ncbi:hypothetical protein FBUS_01948 [Fasciolopsis buskii]|uniref:Ig-like domain-containing protein n=1 Tax=Fasciolopsis buskii TaxID=27845 RepID=A0A8E0RWH1_9TREM|nr:hypothetical protein FBUS_01948 [Fasciolopsis buski]
MRFVATPSAVHCFVPHLTHPPPLNISLVCTILIIFVFVWKENHVDAVQGCSVFFQPDFKWKKAICDSETSRLDRIPPDLPNNLVELHVTHQFITVLSAENLRGLVHLQTLAVESSGLRRVMLDAFHSLTNLTQLNLRNNSLQLGYNGLPAEVVRGLPRLKMLNLAENPVEIVPDFFFTTPGSGVPSPLHRLWLSSTKSATMHVGRQAFVGLRYLRLLDLSDSKLTTLPVSFAGQLDLMLELNELYLGGNPWHCDCQLRWLRTWFVNRQARNKLTYLQQRTNRYGRQVISEPICFSPESLRDRKLFGSDPVGTIDFSETNCAPKLLTVHQNVTLMANKINKLICEFYSDPKATVSWFRDGVLIKNDSRFNVINQFVEETLISVLYAKFTRVGDTTMISCSLDGYHGDIAATYYVTIVPYDPTLDTDHNGLSGALESVSFSVTQQSWIYAGVGAGTLFILLTAIGVGIFYCCDPRSHADQTFHRIVSKDQVSRLQSCYGCPKITKPERAQNGDDSHEKSTDVSGTKSNDTRSQNGDEIDGIEMRTRVTSQNNISTDHVANKTTIISSGNSTTVTSTISPMPVTSPSGLTALGGSLIRETVSTGENRLLVSCDGPEPTVLLATRFSAYNDLSSPSSVYGMFDTNKLSPSIKVSLPGSVGSYICSPSFSGQNSTVELSDKTHIYASLSPVTNLHGMHAKTPQLISIPKTRYTTPCPVHGSIQLNRVDFSPMQNTVATSESINTIDTTLNSIGELGGMVRLNPVIGANPDLKTPVLMESKSTPSEANSCIDLSGKSRLGTLPELWYRPAIDRAEFRTSSPDHDESEDAEYNHENGDENEEEEENDDDDDEDEDDDEEEEEDDDDDSGLLSHSKIVIPTGKPDISFRDAAQFTDPRRFKSRGGTTLHRPKSFTVLNSRMTGNMPSLITPQSGNVHIMHSDRRYSGRGYSYSSNEKALSSSGANTPPTRHAVRSKLRSVPGVTSQRAAIFRPFPRSSGGLPYKSCMRTSFSGDLNRVHDTSVIHENTGSNQDTSDETWNSNSDSETPTEETSSITQAVEVMSNTERSTYEENEFVGFPRHAAVRRRGSSSTLNFPSTGWSKYPTASGLTFTAGAALPGGLRPTSAGAYRVATLPSRLRQSRSPGSVSSSAILSGPLMRTKFPGGSHRDFVTLQRRSSAQRSQTLIRPGSKHKLDTDSGTDNND